jgi:hypothetical protein
LRESGLRRAPVIGEPFDVRDLVSLVGCPKALEPGLAHLGSSGRADDDRNELGEGVVDRRPDRPRGAVDVLEGWREALNEGHCAVGREHRLGARYVLNLTHRLLHALDRGL